MSNAIQRTVKPINIFESDLRDMQHWYLQASDKLEQWASGVPEGYSTGFKAIDGFTRLVNGELTLIAARPSQGKTALAMQMVENVARQLRQDGDPGCVAVFSAEMGGWSLYTRMAAAMCEVSTHKLRAGKGTPDEINRMREAMRTLRTLPIWIDDNTGPTGRDMLDQLTRLNLDVPVRAMMFDYVELGGDRESREDIRIGRIAQQLKGIAKTLQIPVIALSQLNRDVEDRKDKRPTLADLRYSGALEQIADVVLLLMRPEYYVERGENITVELESDKRGVAYVQVAKNRNGPVGLSRLAFIKDRVMFGDLAREFLPGVRR